jgi:hypothetical protein
MMLISLYDYQQAALTKLRSGSILRGGVGSGKSRTGLAFYFKENGGKIGETTDPIEQTQPLIIITTAKKRDSLEWEKELANFCLTAKIDSWNNIKKYRDEEGAFFIFDEQKLIGSGVWVKSFLRIAKHNQWIILTATPGDDWVDYIPVFLANGFYKTRSEFLMNHVVYKPYSKFPQIQRYLGTAKLNRLRNEITVVMKYKSKNERHDKYHEVPYDVARYNQTTEMLWNFDLNCPVKSAPELCYLLRRIVNSNPSRVEQAIELVANSGRAIIFYNFIYEKELLKEALEIRAIAYAEWNGQKHEPVPTKVSWAYLVQYNSGAEAWECTTCNTVIFYSLNYSYKMLEQSKGRPDRVNSPFDDLHYHYLVSSSSIDKAILKCLEKKQAFNDKEFLSERFA